MERLQWMEDGDGGDLRVQVGADLAAERRRAAARRRRRQTAREAAMGRRPRGVAAWVAAAVALAMAVHEVYVKSLASGLALGVLGIYGATLLKLVLSRWESGPHRDTAFGLFLMGFGPGLLLLSFSELLVGITVLGYHCTGVGKCTVDAMSSAKTLKSLPELVYNSPFHGLIFAFVLAFFNTALLEEGLKLFFVSGKIVVARSRSSSSSEAKGNAGEERPLKKSEHVVAQAPCYLSQTAQTTRTTLA
jgi:hypothetical protein